MLLAKYMRKSTLLHTPRVGLTRLRVKPGSGVERLRVGRISRRLLESPADDAFDLGVLLNLLLLQAALAVLQAVLVLLQDLAGLLLLRHEPLLVLLQLAVGQLEPLLQGVDLLLVLFDLEFTWERMWTRLLRFGQKSKK